MNQTNFQRSRRRLLKLAAALVAAPRRSLGAEDIPLRIGLTPVFLDDQVGFLGRWRAWLEKKLLRPVVFIQRGSYREIVELLLARQIDFAWLCGYPYIRHRHRLQLVAVPLWRGRPLYQSYLIVPVEDEKSQSLMDLRGRVFAYSDPDSNSGFLYANYLLAKMGENPATFFSRSFYTWAHRKVIEAVGIGLAHGGAVDGYVWETLAEFHPSLARATRIIQRSGDLGFPPFVAREDIGRIELEDFRSLLTGMATDPEGTELLHAMRLDGFTAGSFALYEEIARMARMVAQP
ncbi:MAG: PhnD/SsuA/transferrin family substrate-binding protein [Rhodocyclaceae bacterium]